MPRAITQRASSLPALAGAAALTLALFLVPQLDVIARPLSLLSTVVHELGHGVVALLLGGDLHRLSIWSDGSGLAQYAGDFGRLASAAIAAGGLLGPPVAAMFLFVASRGERPARRALAVCAAVLLIALVLWVRNLFGLFFVGSLAGVLILLLWKASATVAQLVTAFLAMQLTLSVFSRADYLFTSSAQTAQGVGASDTAQIAQALWLPYWVWGALIAGMSLAILFVGLRSAASAMHHP